MSTARWRHQTADVSMDSVNVRHALSGAFEVQLGAQVLWVSSRAHWDDIAAKVSAGFASLGAPRPVSLPVKGMKANVAGACWGEDE